MDTKWDVYLSVRDKDKNRLHNDCLWGSFDSKDEAFECIEKEFTLEDFPWIKRLRKNGATVIAELHVYEKPCILVSVKRIEGEDA